MLLILLGCVATEVGSPIPGAEDTSSPVCEHAAGLATITVESGTPDGYLLIPWYDPGGGDAGVVVVDPDGCVAWSADAAAYPTAARFSGSDIWFNQQGEAQGLHRRALDGSGGEDIETPNGHHDFYVHADGTLAWIAEEVREIDGMSVAGDLIRERAPDGTLTDVWTAFREMTVEQHAGWGEEPYDWTHANGLAYDPATGRYVVSLYWTAQLVEADRATGRIVHILDGDDVPEPFGRPQHAPSFLADGVRVFDNAGPTGSRVLELGWDGTVRRSWSPPDRMDAVLLGDAFERDDGVLIVGFGTEGVAVAVGPEGDERWRIRADGVVFGRMDWRASLP